MESFSIPYCYSQLQSSQNEIRLIQLHPGTLSDNIHLSILHVFLRPPDETAPKFSLQKLRATLPPDWEAHEDTDQKILFYYEDSDGNCKSTWTHPDPNIDPNQYKTKPKKSVGPRYEALSYTWGSRADDEVAYVIPAHASTSKESATELQIGRNLALALRHLRYEDRVRTIWADAICINQQDQSEREEQVKRMSYIYKEADQVVVWLGPGSVDSGIAMRTLSFIGEQVVTTMDSWILASPEAVELDWCYSAVGLPYESDTWITVNSFLSRDWFNRVWILQEIHLASNAILQCGLDQMSWSHFRRAIVLLWTKFNACPSLSRPRIAFIEPLVNPIQSNTPISLILRLANKRKCADPRDMIYGVLGLFHEDFQKNIYPQYSLPAGDIYTSFVRSHIGQVKRLELLRYCRSGYRTTSIPSWVPDYSKEDWVKPAEWQFCSGYSACHVMFREPNILEAEGVYAATVRTVSGPIPNYRHEADRISLRDSTSAARNLLGVDLSGKGVGAESQQDIFARTITGNYLKDRFPEPRVDTLEQWKERIQTKDDIFGEDLTFQEEYSLGILLDRTYLTTEEGYIGLGPPDAQPGMVHALHLSLYQPSTDGKEKGIS